MSRTSVARRAWTRTGATAVIVALVLSVSAVPAAAGAVPAVNNFNPDSAPVGATVHVYGANFTGATSVRFNGVAATPFTVVGPGNIVTTVPAGATTGPVSVTTTAGTGTSSANFVVTQGNGLTITSFTPTSGSVGTAVAINGTGFSNVNAVRFNGVSATFSVASTTRINTTVPGGATTGKISVATSAGTVTSGGTFTVGPKITGLAPNSGSPGTSVTITGTSFTGVTAVRFNGVSATFSFVSVNRVDTVVPSGATTGRVTLTTPSGTATSPADFTVSAGVHPRSISLFLGRGATRARLFATGSVSVIDSYNACLRHVPVVIKRFRRGAWRWVATTSTGQNGGYRVHLVNRAGRFRAKAVKITLVNGAVCGGRLSNVVQHHR
jgi:large repetitive protein